MNKNFLYQRDLKLNWHPCAQMKDYEQFKPLVIHKAYDCYLELDNGKKIIDAISSWWCKSLGHGNPLLKQALAHQIEKFEHVIFANTTYETIVKLSEKLALLIPKLNKIFYAGDGSCAVEIALKMSLHSRVIKGESHRNKFIALKNGYHGETLGALSVSDVGLYKKPYHSILFEPFFINPLYVPNIEHSDWENASVHWEKVEKKLSYYAKTSTAIILEPILQGAGGMKLYSQDFLSRLAAWAKQHDIHLIADEIMTGLGRTGKMLACEYANIIPDFICLSKGLTSGWVSFSAILTTQNIYDIFYDDFESEKSFLHSHTYCGNAIGAAVALETLNIIENNHLCERANVLHILMRQYMEEIASETNFIENIRGIGAMIAADIIPNDSHHRIGYKLYQEAVRQGALLRPLGNTLYWMPPLTISEEALRNLKEITYKSILKFI